MLQERWPLWKAGLYDLEMISPQGCNFWTGGLVYDKSLNCYIITIQACCKEGGCYEMWAFRLDVDKEYHHRDVFSGWVDLVYDNRNPFSHF